MKSTAPQLPGLSITVISPDGDLLNEQFFEPQDSISIGRSSESDIVLADFGTKISRCHAVILGESGSWEYYNLGVNGSYADGQKIETLLLTDGTAVRLSKHGPILQFKLHVVGDASGVAEDGEISGWIRRLREGDEDAAAHIWNRYFDRIVEIAKRSLKDASSRVTDEEDVALLALKSLLTGIKEGRFPALDRRDQLWRLLMVITTRKAAAVIEKDHRQKRGSGNVRGDSAIIAPEFEDSILNGFDQIDGQCEAPDWAALMADETKELMRLLPDEISRQLAILKMEGHTHEEIADKLKCNVRTVERRLKHVRELWSKRLGDE